MAAERPEGEGGRSQKSAQGYQDERHILKHQGARDQLHNVDKTATGAVGEIYEISSMPKFSGGDPAKGVRLLRSIAALGTVAGIATWTSASVDSFLTH